MNIDKCYEAYDQMVYLRKVEEAIAREYAKQQIKTPVHLYIGQEAIAVGVSLNLTDSDKVMSNHRSHGHTLAKGLDLNKFLAELYGKSTGVSSGYGGSMHLVDMEKGILGTSAIVAGGIPIAAGAALAQKLDNTQDITVVYFGDGAVDEGVFWETINFAKLKGVPILFVMEDNGYASQTHSIERHGYKDITHVINGYDIPFYKVDGNDVIEVYDETRKAIERIRDGEGPQFIYARTYRWMGHVGPKDDTETGYRSVEENKKWREHCPILNLSKKLEEMDFENYHVKSPEICNKWDRLIKDALESVEALPYAVD